MSSISCIIIQIPPDRYSMKSVIGILFIMTGVREALFMILL